MGLFTADLYRSFAIGFALGLVGLFAVMGGGEDAVEGAVVGHAIAAPVSQ